MMLTKEECEQALEHFEKCYWDQDNSYGAMNGVRKDLDILNKLIHEHFSNPPLEWEELKEGMWIWDNKDKAYMKIESVCDKDWVWLYIDSSEREHIDELYEPNRFYRKEVEE